MISKEAIDFSENSQVSSFRSDESILEQDPEEEENKMDQLDDNKIPEEENSNQILENEKDRKNDADDSQAMDSKPAGRRKGGPPKAGENLRGAAKAKKGKVIASKKEQGLSKERVFLYKPFVPLPDLSEYVNSLIEIRIGIEYITPYNPTLVKRQIWGNESYTSNSDAVCILKHSGMVDLYKLPNKSYQGLSLICAVGRSRRNYTSFLKNGLKSRKTGGYMGFSLKPQSTSWLSTLGDLEDLIYFASRMCNVLPSKRVKMEPINVKKFSKIPEQAIIFNMCNEPATKYSLLSIADKSSDPEDFTSHLLKTKVLYLETQDSRYELTKTETAEDDLFKIYDTYKLSKIINPLLIDNEFMSKSIIPLPDQYLQINYKDLDWTEIKWGNDFLTVRGEEIKNMRNYKFYDIKKADHKKQDLDLE